jgi:hypothetical protein
MARFSCVERPLVVVLWIKAHPPGGKRFKIAIEAALIEEGSYES